MVDDRPRGLLGVDLGAVRRHRVGARTSACSARARCPGRSGSRAPGSTSPSTSSGRGADDAVAIRHASELRPLAELTQGQLRDEVARARGRPARPRRRPGRPGRRLPAEHPRGGGGVPRLRVDRRDLVELLARLRRPERDRPLRADRAAGAARGRRLPLRRQGLRPRATSSRELLAALPTVEHTVVLGYLDPSPTSTGSGDAIRWDELRARGARERRSRSSRSRSTIRSGCCTARARRGCRRRSSTATAASCSRC